MAHIVAFGKNLYSRGLFFLLIFSCLCSGLSAQRTGIAFWNVENLYDTIPSPFYDDRAYTPDGANHWNTTRYNTKIANLARVLDELSADVVGLAEVENEEVVKDLVRALKTDYNYIHRTSRDARGIDVALLYKGDKFFPDPDPRDPSKPAVRMIPSGTGRQFMHVGGELSDRRIELIVCHLASNLNPEWYRRRNMEALENAIAQMLAKDPAAAIVAMGDMNTVPEKDKKSPHYRLHLKGQGSYNYRGRWYLYDWMMVSPALENAKIEAGIYAKKYLLMDGRPHRSFYAGDYLGGYSDHFPVWISLAK
jgi:endonuclease/exonuclease/phosphatase family metal-dependent hydrolase